MAKVKEAKLTELDLKLIALAERQVSSRPANETKAERIKRMSAGNLSAVERALGPKTTETSETEQPSNVVEINVIVPPQTPKEPEKPKIVDPYKGRFIKINYNLTKDQDKIPVFMNQRTMLDEIMSPDTFGAGKNIGPQPVIPPEQKRNAKGRFYTNSNVNLSKLPNEALHYNEHSMVDDAFSGFVKRNFGTQTFPEAHTVIEPEHTKGNRLRQEKMIQWMSKGLFHIEHAGENKDFYPDRESIDSYTKSHSNKPKTNKDDIAGKTNDLKTLQGKSGDLNTVILREISATLKQIHRENQNLKSRKLKKSHYFSSWRQEEERDKKRDDDFMNPKDKSKNGKAGGHSFLGGLLSEIGVVELLSHIRGLPGKLGTGLGKGAKGLASGGGELLGGEGAFAAGEMGGAAGIGSLVGMLGLLLPMVIAGMHDDKKIKEREVDKDNTRKEEDKGIKNLQSMPTKIQNLFASGEASKSQYDALKSDEEKRKYLQSLGAKDDDINEALKHPEIVSKDDNDGQTGHFSVDPNDPNRSISLNPVHGPGLFDPGSTASNTPHYNDAEHGYNADGSYITPPVTPQPHQGSEPGTLSPQNQGGATQIPHSNKPNERQNPTVSKPDIMVPGSKPVGSISEKYESGGLGVGTVSTGAGDAGGVSYGKYQIASKTGTMTEFLKGPEGKQFSTLQGLSPGSPQFNAAYKQIASGPDAEALDKAQHDFIQRTHFDPVEARAKKLGLDTTNPAIKEALWSQSVQSGRQGNYKILDAVAKSGVNMKDNNAVIKQIYKSRGEYTSQFAGSAATTNRYKKESADVLALNAKTPGGDVAGGYHPDTQLASNNPPKNIPQPSQTPTGEKLIATNNENKDKETKLAKDQPPIIMSPPPTVVAGNQKPTGGTQQILPNSRNDDPVFIRAQLGDLKSA